jgi:hypothetical protein
MKLTRQFPRNLLTGVALLCALAAGGAQGARAADNAASTYLLLGAAKSGLPAGLAEQVAVRRGSITQALPEIGVAIATSTNTDFAVGASSIAGLRSVIPAADDLGKPGGADHYGHGRVNAARAVGAL